jgi:hypothetical protein
MHPQLRESGNQSMVRRVVRATDLEPPQQISGDDFDNICGTFKIRRPQQDEVRNFLSELVEGFGAAIVRDRSFPNRRQDRRALKSAINHLRWTQILLKQKKGPPGQRALNLAGRIVAAAISDAWLRKRFPNEFVEVSPADYDPLPLWPLATDFLSEMENRSLGNRIDFMSRHGGAAIDKLLSDEIAALEKGLRFIIALPDGRRPLRHRAYMLAALAEVWRRIGRRPTSGNSQFGSFCEAVFEAIGWPTEGVKSALPDAIRLRAKLYR